MHQVKPHYAALRNADSSTLQAALQCLRKQVLDRGDQSVVALLEACLAALKTGDEPEALARRIRRDRPRRIRIRDPMTVEQAAEELAEVHRIRPIAKRRRIPPGSRKLDRYRQEILALKKQGASERDIQVYLRRKKGLSVNQSTVHRYLTAKKKRSGG